MLREACSLIYGAMLFYVLRFLQRIERIRSPNGTAVEYIRYSASSILAVLIVYP